MELMDKFEVFNAQNCYICSELMGSFKSDLTVVTGYSEKPIYEHIESFTKREMSEGVIEEAGVCQNCFIKFNEFDEHQTLAEHIQFELVSLLNSKNYETDSEQYAKLTLEEIEESQHSVDDTRDDVEYEQFDDEEMQEEMFVADLEENQETNEIVETEVETTEEDFHYEVIVDDTKENIETKEVKHIVKSKGKDDFGYIIVEMDDNMRAYQCDICQKTFKDKSKLRTHREIHTDERNVICPVCLKAFKTMNCLRNHKRLHVPERTYFNCDQCEKKYTQKIQLKKHIEIVHMQRRDFVCTTCGASFGTNSVLKMHLLSHQDYRAEKCEVCGYRFHTKAKLRRHMKSHTGERNYECAICFKKFLYSYNVVAHIRNVHEKNRKGSSNSFSCKYCLEMFFTGRSLNDHIAKQHPTVVTGESIIVEEEEDEEECLYEFEEKTD